MLTQRVYVFLSIILTVVSIIAGVYLVKNNQNLNNKATTNTFCVQCRSDDSSVCSGFYSANPAFNKMAGHWCGESTCTTFDACAPHVRSGTSCVNGRYTDLDAKIQRLSSGEANNGAFVGCNVDNQNQNCFCDLNFSGNVYCLNDENNDSCAARQRTPTNPPPPTNTPTPVPSNTPTPTNTPTPPPTPINWVINSHVVCPPGTSLTGKTRNFYAYWPPNPLTWQYNNFSVADKTVNLSLMSNSTSSVYLGMETESETALALQGSPPNPLMDFGKYFNPPTMMAHWSKSLPAGTYDLTFLGNDEICIGITTVTPTLPPNPTGTPTPTHTPTPTNTPTPIPTNTPVPPTATPTYACDNNIAAYSIPDPVKPRSPVSFIFTSNQNLTGIQFDPGNGAYQCKLDTVNSARCTGNITNDSRNCWWKWDCTSQDDLGRFTAKFTNNENCPKELNYGLGTFSTTPTPTVTPINTPTPKPTTISQLHPTPTETILLPSAGVDFPVQMFTICGAIVILIGFLLL